LTGAPGTKEYDTVRVVLAVEFRYLPPNLSVQYRVSPGATVNPLVDAGGNHPCASDGETLATIQGISASVGNQWGLAAQAGLLFKAGRNWDIVADVRYIDLDAKVKLNGADIGKVDVNPLVYGISVNFRF